MNHEMSVISDTDVNFIKTHSTACPHLSLYLQQWGVLSNKTDHYCDIYVASHSKLTWNNNYDHTVNHKSNINQ